MYLMHTELATTVSKLRDGSKDLIRYILSVCDRMEAVDPKIQAFLPEEGRRERLLLEAEALLKKYPDPKSRPALFGIPIGVKDLFRTDGFHTRAGSKLPPQLFSGEEASSVTRLKEAGALIAGKTVTTEFAYFQPGPTRNPHNPDHTPGGSSSGSAAAVAAGMVPFAFGTQTIGSVSRPAAFCGIVGFKPSYGRIAADGVVPFSVSADHIGFFTQDLEGVKVAAPLLCDNWNSGDAAAEVAKPVLAVPEGAYLEQTEPEALELFKQQLTRMEKQGFIIKRIPLLNDIEEINISLRTMIAAELAETHREWFPAHKDLYSKRTAELILEGQKITPDTLAQAIESGHRLRSVFETAMDQHGIDLFITPSAPGPAPEGIDATGNPCMNLPWTYSGLPTLALPTAKSPVGLPVGIQLAGRFGQDEQLIASCRSMEYGV